MIASVQVTSGVRAFGAARSTSPTVPHAPSFQSEIGKYHSAHEAESDESGAADAKNYTSRNSASAGVAPRTQHPAQPPSTHPPEVKNDSESAASVAQDQESDTPAYFGEAQEARASRFHTFLRKLHSAESVDAQPGSAQAAGKNTNVGTPVIPVLPLHTVEPLRIVLPLKGSLTLRQSGSAAQDSPAALSESAAAAEDAPPVPLSPPQLQAEDATASGSLAFAARLTPAAETASAKAAGPQSAAQRVGPEAAGAENSQTKSVAEAANSPAAKQLLAADSLGTAGDAPNGHGGDSAPHQNPSDLFATAPAPIIPAATPGQAQTPAEKPINSSAQASSASHVDKAIDPPPVSPGASHDITVRIPNASDQSTAVRFLERGGEVHVSVRTTDTEMAQTLRGGLNELVNRLQDGGIQTEIWQPGSDAFSSKDGQQHQFTNPDGSNGNSSGSHSEQESGQQPKPRWLEELENTVGNLKETSQLWQA